MDRASKTFSKRYIPKDPADTATPSKLKPWAYLEGIKLMDKINERDDISVGLLISANCTKALDALNITPVTMVHIHSKQGLVAA